MTINWHTEISINNNDVNTIFYSISKFHSFNVINMKKKNNKIIKIIKNNKNNKIIK